MNTAEFARLRIEATQVLEARIWTAGDHEVILGRGIWLFRASHAESVIREGGAPIARDSLNYPVLGVYLDAGTEIEISIEKVSVTWRLEVETGGLLNAIRRA